MRLTLLEQRYQATATARGVEVHPRARILSTFAQFAGLASLCYTHSAPNAHFRTKELANFLGLGTGEINPLPLSLICQCRRLLYS